MAQTISYRCATVEDSDAILEIYRHYVEHTAVTFEHTVPTPEAFRLRVQSVLAHYPYIVAVLGTKIVGYAYASPYRPREGFAWTAELSVYVREDLHRHGIGSHLFGILLDLLRLQGFCNVVSVLSKPNEASESLHYRFGFRCAGVQLRCGYKLDAWHDVALFERCLSEYSVPPAPTVPFSSLDAQTVGRILQV